MTRKEYILIAAAIAEVRDEMIDSPARVAGAAQTARRIGSALRRDNPRFDRDKFLNDLRAAAAKRKEADRDLPVLLADEAQALIDKLGPTD